MQQSGADALDFVRQATGGFELNTLKNHQDPKLRALGTQIEKAF